MEINTYFQNLVVDIFSQLFNQDKLWVKETVFDNLYGKKIISLQIISDTRYDEICMLTQTETLETGEKTFTILFNGKPANWNPDVIKRFIDIALQKSEQDKQQNKPRSICRLSKPEIFFC